MIKILQGNLNTSGPGQDLFLQDMAKLGAKIEIISEPNHIPRGSTNWIAARTNLAAVVWENTLTFPCKTLQCGHSFAVVKCGNVVIISCYLTLAMDMIEYDVTLEEMTDVIREYRGTSVVLVRDFNARMRIWGCSDDTQKGKLLIEAMEALDMQLMNTEGISTYVRV